MTSLPKLPKLTLTCQIFKCKTSIKLPGSFVSKFWNTLVFQSSYSEPAVLHAALAVSSAHQNDKTKTKEQFTLNQYLKAIIHLQPHFSSKDRGSIRIALITCLLFVSLEFLRGHFATAQLHLQNGLKVLKEVEMDELKQKFPPDSRKDTMDVWIVEAFSRLHLQVELFNYGHQYPYIALQTTTNPLMQASEIHSIDEAWRGLEQLFNKTFQLTHQCRQQEIFLGVDCSNIPALLSQQRNILTSLENWLQTFNAFAINIPENLKPHEGVQAFQLLYSYHTLCLIMASTSLHPTSESVYDTQLTNFHLLISQLDTMREISSKHLLEEERLDMPKSIIDMGWIPPLYFTATKCRDHWIRRQALELLESGSHREGIWDSRITSWVARKVVDMEERVLFAGFGLEDYLSLGGKLNPRVSRLPTLPLSYRLREVEMVLLGSPMDRIQLFGKEEREGDGCRVLLSEYDVGLQCWTDRISLDRGE